MKPLTQFTTLSNQYIIVLYKLYPFLKTALLTTLFLGSWIYKTDAQSFSETLLATAEFDTPRSHGNTIRIYNIQGEVVVEGYDGDQVEIVAEKQIRADNHRDLERGKNELEFIVEEKGDDILIYFDAPFINMKRKGNGIYYNMNLKRGQPGYDFLFNITIRVPAHVNLYASTINKGDVIIENMDATELTAANINGKIFMTNVAGKTKASTVNGDIRILHSKNPTENSEYKTVNGSIEVLYPDDLAADVHFKSLHGNLYTDFENVERLLAKTETGTDNRKGGTTYRINRFTPLRIGSGGPELRFEMINGDVYIKRIKS